MSDDFAKFLTFMAGITTVAIIAVILNKNRTGVDFAQTFFSGFAADINAAVSPVTGNSTSIGLNNLGIG